MMDKKIGVFLIFLFVFSIIPSSSTEVEPDRLIEFEGIKWKKDVMQRGPTNVLDVYEPNKNKIGWSVVSGALVVEEVTATTEIYAGVSIEFVADSTTIYASMDSRNTATHSSPQSNGVGLAIHYDNGLGSYDRHSLDQISNLATYTSVNHSVTGLTIGQTYKLMVLFSDGWPTDYDQTIYFKNFGLLGGSITEYTVKPPRIIDFEAITWTKEAIQQGSINVLDVFDANRDKINWSIVDNAMVVEEVIATNGIYAGVSFEFLASTTAFWVAMESRNTATHPSPQTNGVALAIYYDNGLGAYDRHSLDKLSDQTTYTSVNQSVTGLTIGQTYKLVIAYSDGWADDYDQTIYFKNFQMEQYTPEPPRTLDFEGRSWTKELRGGINAGLVDYYDTEKAGATWGVVIDELVASELNTKVDRYVGFSTHFIAEKSHYNLTLDAKAIADIDIARDVRAAVIDVATDGTWSMVGGQQGITMSSSWSTVTVNFAGLVVGDEYLLFIYYADAYSAILNQEMHIKNLNLIAVTPRTIDFEDISWKKTVMTRGSVDIQDVYDINKDKISWSIIDGALVVEEVMMTTDIYAGVSFEFLANTSAFWISLDSRNTATHSSPQNNGVGLAVYYDNGLGAYDRHSLDLLSNQTTYTSVNHSVTGLTVGQTYNLMILFSDGWPTDYDQTIYFKDFQMKEYTIEPSRTIEFEGITWTKEAIQQGSTNVLDVYDSNRDRISWTVIDNTMVIEEITATDGIYAGVSFEFLANTTTFWVSMDSRNTASNPSPQANGVALAIYYDNGFGAYDRHSLHLLSDQTSYTSVNQTVSDLIVGQTYKLVIAYSDGWSDDYDQTIYFKNFQMVEYEESVPTDTSEPTENTESTQSNESTQTDSDKETSKEDSETPELDVPFPTNFWIIFLALAGMIRYRRKLGK